MVYHLIVFIPQQNADLLSIAIIADYFLDSDSKWRNGDCETVFLFAIANLLSEWSSHLPAFVRKAVNYRTLAAIRTINLNILSVWSQFYVH